MLEGWTLDLATARQLGLQSTGNASRGTGAPPSPAAGNLALTQGTASRDELIAAMGTGLLVTSLIGAAINPTTGDYSRGASGFWVEGGEIARPVNECTIAGNLRDDAADHRAGERRPARTSAGWCRACWSRGWSLPARDLALLLEAAARAPATIALRHFGRPSPAHREKPGGHGPVTEADLEVDRMLRES